MKNFNHPEYQSYIALCEKLNLQHKLDHRDYFYEHTPPGVVSEKGVAHVLTFTRQFEWLEEDLGQFWYWLPTLSDWLDKLKDDGLCVGFSVWQHHGATWACRPIQGGAIDYDWEIPDSSTPEEAAARLWMDMVAERNKIQEILTRGRNKSE